jgi:hypothetical protein
MIVNVTEYVIVNFRARFVNLGHRKNVSRSNVWLTKLAWRLRKNSRDRLMFRLVLQVLLRGHDNLLLQAFLRGWHIKHPHKWIRRHFSSCLSIKVDIRFVNIMDTANPYRGVTLEGPCPHKRTLYGSCPRKRTLGGYCLTFIYPFYRLFYLDYVYITWCQRISNFV